MRSFVFGAIALAISAASASATVKGQAPIPAPLEDLKVPGENPIEYCADPKDYLLSLDEINLDPNPPRPGEKLVITGSGILSKEVDTGSTIHLLVKLGFVQLLKENIDLCDNVDQVNLTCPLPEGQRTKVHKEVDIPAAIPPGTFAVMANLTTADDEIITCLKASIKFSRGGSVLGQWRDSL